MADAHEPFSDPILGQVVWNIERSSWEFGVVMPSGRTIRGSILPEENVSLLEREESRIAIRNLVAWVIAHEPELRGRVAEKLFPGWLQGWYDEETDEITTIEGFREAIRLDGLLFYNDYEASLFYNDGNLFGGHGIEVTIDANGNITESPEIWG